MCVTQLLDLQTQAASLLLHAVVCISRRLRESATSPPKVEQHALETDPKGGNRVVHSPATSLSRDASVQALLAMSAPRREAWTGELYRETLHMHQQAQLLASGHTAQGCAVPEAVVLSCAITRTHVALPLGSRSRTLCD